MDQPADDIEPVYGTFVGPWRRRFVIFPKWTTDDDWLCLQWGWKRRVIKHAYVEDLPATWWMWRRSRPA